MSGRRWLVLVNPTSGRGRGARWGRGVVEELRDAGEVVGVVIGVDAADAQRRAREALRKRWDGVVAVGGDGLVHLALNLASEYGLPLGLVPAGTGNDFARAAGVPVRDPERAVAGLLAALESGAGTRVDLGRIAGGPVFGCVLSAGFDATVNARANRIGFPRGRARYPLAMLIELPRFSPVSCQVVVDGVVHDHAAMLVAVGNGPSYGGGMRICPEASLSDGLLDVTVLDEVSVQELLRVFPRVYRGTHTSHPRVQTYRGSTVELRFGDGRAPAVFADGEPMALTVQDAGLSATVEAGAVELLTHALT